MNDPVPASAPAVVGGVGRPPPTAVPSRPAHAWAYVLLHGLGVTAALWQHGQPGYTVAVLAATGLLVFVPHVPERWLPAARRRRGQYGLAAAVVGWLLYRHFAQGAAADLLVIEGLAGGGLVLAFATRARDYGYLLLFATILVGYGVLLPPRPVSTYVLPLAGSLALLLLYLSRPAALAPARAVDTRGTLPRRILPLVLGHAGLVLLAALFLFNLVPLRDREYPGRIPLAFVTRPRPEPAPTVERWLHSPRYRQPVRGATAGDGTRPSPTSPKSRWLVEDDGGFTGQDDGGVPPGTDLVMQVKSPLRLYWLAALYDNYDGRHWRASRSLQRHDLAAPGLPSVGTTVVTQHVTVEKWVTPVFCSAFRKYGGLGGLGGDYRTLSTFYHERLAPGEAYPELPFSYTVSAVLGGSSTLDAWAEPLRAGHYLDLPEGRIPARVLDRARQLVAAAATPLERALALRDYLRASCRYTRRPRPVPPDRETTDYLLFDRQEGHCVYFAGALAVMARAAGLPARVATGFAPGQYNAVTGCFEVYEYHAHAWTQIWVENQGWLTMDATPPGAPPLAARGSALGRRLLRDPFGDAWRAAAPELDADVECLARDQGELRADTAAPGWLSRWLAGGAPPAGRAAGQPPGASGPALWRVIHVGLRDAARDAWRRAHQFLATRTSGQLAAALGAASAALGLLLAWPAFRRRREQARRLVRCQRHYRRAQDARDRDPAQCIRHCYRLVRDLLLVAGCPRPPGGDLVDYANGLHHHDLELSKATLAVFVAYTHLEYTPTVPTERDAADVLASAARVRACLLRRLGRKYSTGEVAAGGEGGQAVRQ